jgi:Tfp pilus assembly protein PilF
VLPFRVIGADSALGLDEAALLSTRFTGEVGPRAVDAARTLAAWRATRARLETGSTGDRDIARSLGASQWITGDVVLARDSVTIMARLYDATHPSALASARADAPAGVSAAALGDRLAIELLARVAGEPDDRIPELLAHPVAAARSYLAGQVAYRGARYAVAESLYAASLAGDSTFGAAGLGLALANSWTVINDHYGMGRDAALHHLAAMSDRDRAFAEAFFGPDPALGPPQPAPVYLKRWEDLVERYPDWTEAWYQLGDRYYHYGSLSGLSDAADRALTAFRRAESQDSSFAAPLNHLVELYAARGELPQLRDASDRYFHANPSVSRDRSAIGWQTAMALGDSAWLQRIRSQFDSMPPEELTRIGWVTDANGWPRGDATRAAATLNRDAGTASEHERALTLAFALALNAGDMAGVHAAATALGAQFPDRPVAALWELYAALFGDSDASGRDAAAAAHALSAFASRPVSGDHVRRDQAHLAACLVGYWHATQGDVTAARAALARVRADVRAEDNQFVRRNADVCTAMLGAVLAVRGAEPSAPRELARLDTILLEQRVPPHAILEAATIVSAQMHADLGDTTGALLAARRREHLTGDPLFLTTELRLEARYAAALGDSDEAARATAHVRALVR